MKKFVALQYIPGAAGNFLSRCINLLDNTYIWSKNGQLPQTLEEKAEMFSYKNYKPGYSWSEFEAKLRPYYEIQPHHDIDKNGIAMFVCHPGAADRVNEFTGVDDQAINILIDHKDKLAWCILNGNSKNSQQSIYWLQSAEILKNNPLVYKVDLNEIISGYERFHIEFLKLAEFLERPVTPQIELALKTLYNDWYKTTLQGDRLEKYRQEAIEMFTKILELLKNND